MQLWQRFVLLHWCRFVKSDQQAGFTLTEAIATISIAGVLATIAALGWVAFLNRRHLTSAQDRVFQQIRLAQTQAESSRTVWQVSFRNVDDRLQAAVHTADAPPGELPWEDLIHNIQIDPTRTTLYQKDGVYRVQFSQVGRVNGRLGRMTLQRSADSPARSCVIVSTLLGAARKGHDQECRVR
ncbi:pilus assembly FimT family protein [Leptolyngbya sp. AN02str]|uniref:pilus assembly FimT family protein n=1 Tax=Leptolyngbya sp. AN02str TaxID=3423363 RepID=UPI003D314CB0